MQSLAGYLIAGILGLVALSFAVSAGYWEGRVSQHFGDKAVRSASSASRQTMERRRARMAEVAIAGSTAK